MSLIAVIILAVVVIVSYKMYQSCKQDWYFMKQKILRINMVKVFKCLLTLF